MRYSIIFLAVIILTLVFTVQFTIAEVFHVPDDFETIQEAIDESQDSDTVLVDPGEYVENIDFDGHDIVVGSLFITTGDTAYVERTIIDGDSTDSVVIIASGEDENTILTGLTIRNGYTHDEGGGIWIRDSSPTLRRLVIINNAAFDGGGGVLIERDAQPVLDRVVVTGNSVRNGRGGGILIANNADPSIINCVISDNYAYYGGGVGVIDGSEPSFLHVLIDGNEGHELGGGVYCTRASLLIEDVVISNNLSGPDFGRYGGGIYSFLSNLELIGVTIRDNLAHSGGAIYGYYPSDISLTDCVIENNEVRRDGGGIFAFTSCNIHLNHILISGNQADRLGGGIYFNPYNGIGSNLELFNVTITGNAVVGGNGDVWEGGGIYMTELTLASMVNCVIWNNRRSDELQQIYVNRRGLENELFIAYSDIENGEDGIEDNHNVELIWGEGNIDADPLFVDPDDGDYHLNEDSPCIDTGDPDSDPDPDNTRADMGAFYFPQDNPDPDIHVQPDSVAFPLTGVDSLAYAIVTIRNFGGDTLNVASQTLVDADEQFFLIDGFGEFMLTPQGVHETTISFEPIRRDCRDSHHRKRCSDDPEHRR